MKIELTHGDLLDASMHAKALRDMAVNEKAQYKKRILYDASTFLLKIANYFDDESPSCDE